MKFDEKEFIRKHPQISLVWIPTIITLVLYFLTEKVSEIFIMYVFPNVQYSRADELARGIGGFVGILVYIAAVFWIFLKMC